AGGGERHTHLAQGRHGAQQLPAADRCRSGDLSGACRWPIADMRARRIAADDPALFPVLIFSSDAMLTMLLDINKRLPPGREYSERLVLPFDQRQKSRLRVRLDSGIEAALMLERGTILRGGDRMLSGDGRIVLVVAADEPVMQVTASNPAQLMRAAYHLGNRHVLLQISQGDGQDGTGWLRLEQDHVLKEMLLGLDMTVQELLAPFEPEAGAYGGGYH